MCIGVKRRAAPVGGFSNQYANVALLNQINEKAQPSRVPSALGLAPLSSSSSSSYTKNTRPGKHHITVQHNYHDHAYDVNCGQPRRMPKGGVVTPFPLKLHSMLDAVEKEGLEHIVSWQPHGRCFVVHDPKAFADILAEHFKVSKVSSFQRQLNLYGFQRLTKGKDRGGYYHELFLRGKVFLAQSIQRIKVKGTKIRARSNPDQEPNFYAMPWVVENNKKTITTTTNSSYNNRAVVERDPLDELVGLTIPPSMWDLDETPIAEINADIPASMWREEDAKFADEAETFFEDFDFPENDSAFENIEDDDVFGDLLEQMIGV